MSDKKSEKSEVEKACEDLFEFAIDREATKWLLAHLPETSTANRSTVEYELQILRIISVGWSLSYFLYASSVKDQLVERFWNTIQEFSHGISEATGLMIGKDINYFQTVRERLDTYVAAMEQHPDATDPARIIGPEFARLCGDKDDIFTFMAGSKMFMASVAKVKEYLEAVKLR